MVCLPKVYVLNQISKIVPAMQNSFAVFNSKGQECVSFEFACSNIFFICFNSLENLVALGMIISNKVL